MVGIARRVLLVLATLVGFLGIFEPSVPVTAAHGGRSSACIYDHQSLRTAKGTCRPRARAYPASVRGTVQRSIYDAALTFGIPYRILFKVAKCESDLNPMATYGGHYGLYQFLPNTFISGVIGMRVETGIEARSYWNALDSSYVAGYLFVTGDATDWACL